MKMIDGYIFGTFSLLIVLIAIRFGLLEVFSITLSIVALIPPGVIGITYFTRMPKLYYQASGARTHEGDVFYYDLTLGLDCRKGTALIHRFYLSYLSADPKLNQFSIDKAPGVVAAYEYELFEHDPKYPFPALILNKSEKPLFEKLIRGGGPIRLTSKLDVSSLRIKLTADVKTDPFQQGLLSILNPLFNYRFQREVEVKFNSKGSYEELFPMRTFF